MRTSSGICQALSARCGCHRLICCPHFPSLIFTADLTTPVIKPGPQTRCVGERNFYIAAVRAWFRCLFSAAASSLRECVPNGMLVNGPSLDYRGLLNRAVTPHSYKLLQLQRGWGLGQPVDCHLGLDLRRLACGFPRMGVCSRIRKMLVK